MLCLDPFKINGLLLNHFPDRASLTKLASQQRLPRREIDRQKRVHARVHGNHTRATGKSE
jgi:hypothetical protein